MHSIFLDSIYTSQPILLYSHYVQFKMCIFFILLLLGVQLKMAHQGL